MLWVTVAVGAGTSSTYFWRAECVTCPFRAGITPCLGTYLKLVSGYRALLLFKCPEMPLTFTPAFFLSPLGSNMIQTFITPKSSNYEESPILFLVLSYLLSISNFFELTTRNMALIQHSFKQHLLVTSACLWKKACLHCELKQSLPQLSPTCQTNRLTYSKLDNSVCVCFLVSSRCWWSLTWGNNCSLWGTSPAWDA